MIYDRISDKNMNTFVKQINNIINEIKPIDYEMIEQKYKEYYENGNNNNNINNIDNDKPISIYNYCDEILEVGSHNPFEISNTNEYQNIHKYKNVDYSIYEPIQSNVYNELDINQELNKDLYIKSICRNLLKYLSTNDFFQIKLSNDFILRFYSNDKFAIGITIRNTKKITSKLHSYLQYKSMNNFIEFLNSINDLYVLELYQNLKTIYGDNK